MIVDRCSLPKIDESLDDMKGNTVFTTVDLFQGYCKIKMEKIYQNNQFDGMPFGRMNSQATF